MLTALRGMQRPAEHQSSVLGIGDPALNELPCSYPLADLPKTVLHRDVLCLGEPPGMADLVTSMRDSLGGPEPFLNRNATLGNVLKADYTKTGVLLFATHALVPPEREFPDLSEAAIVLTPSTTDSADDGLLRASQIAKLNLSSIWISIIAACRSGAPAENDPEGFTGLGFAFIAAGSRSLIVSHWYVDADSTRQLLERATKLMKANVHLSVSKGLRAAMLDLRKDATVTPQKWAPFVLVGDGDRSLSDH
jgi:CHAT domain-containing protein